MKAMLVAVFLTLTVGGCDGPKGSEGPQGPAGAVGPIGPRGESGDIYVYVDADGKEVDTDQSLTWTDDKGWQWAINPATATATAYGGPQDEWYASVDCSGDAHVNGSYLPRRPIVRRSGGYWVREDDAIHKPVFIGSVWEDFANRCTQTQGHTANVYRLVYVEGLVLPTLPYRPPLRLERRR